MESPFSNRVVSDVSTQTLRVSLCFFDRKFCFLVSLGSIPELPADSCAEIKADEGGHAVSGSYWLDLTKSGNSTLVLCDMTTGG